MAVVAASSFWIHQMRLVGPFSPIHLLSIFTLVMSRWRCGGPTRIGSSITGA
jgi:uncharacterized membrane protein